MEVFRRLYQRQVREFVVYPLDEALEKGLKPVPWRDAREGDWAITDDGFAVECLSRTEHTELIRGKKKGRCRSLLALSIARIWTTKGAKLLWEERRLTGRHGSVSRASWAEREARRTRTRNVVKAYAQMAVSGQGIDWHALGMLYRGDQAIPAATVKRLFKQEVIQKMIAHELAALMSNEGITPQFVIQKMKKAADIAELRSDAGNLLKVSLAFADFLNMSNQQQVGKVPQIAAYDRYDNMVESAEAEFKMLKEAEVAKESDPE